MWGKSKRQEEKKYILTKYSKKSSSVTCISTADCSHQKTQKVCEKSSKTGEKTCKKPNSSSCKSVCADGEYCDGENGCRNGKAKSTYFLDNKICLPVTCGISSDCSTIPGRSVCKQEKDEKRTCQPPSEIVCLDDEFLTFEEKCHQPGNIRQLIAKFGNLCKTILSGLSHC